MFYAIVCICALPLQDILAESLGFTVSVRAQLLPPNSHMTYVA